MNFEDADVLGGLDAIRTLPCSCFAAAYAVGWRVPDVPRSQRADSPALTVRRNFVRGAPGNGVENGVDFFGPGLPAGANRLYPPARPGPGFLIAFVDPSSAARISILTIPRSRHR